MLKIEAIKSTWYTLSKEDQLGLLSELQLRTMGLCKETAYTIHPAKHIYEVCGPLSYEQYKTILQKYFSTMDKVKSGKILVEFSSYKKTTICMFTKCGNFELKYTNNIDWEESKTLTKNEFLKYIYGEYISHISLDDSPLALSNIFKE